MMLFPTLTDHLYDDQHETLKYDILTALYVVFIVAKLVGLILIPVFPVSTHRTVHYITAGVAYGSATMCCSLLFFRRFSVRETNRHYKSETGRLILRLNTLFILTMITVGVFFVSIPTQRGNLEFVLTCFIMLDRIWQISDYWHDTVDITGYRVYPISE